MKGPARAAVTVVIVVIGVMAVLWALQRQLIYFPDRGSVPAAATVRPDARDVELRTGDGLRLAAWLLPPTADDRRMAVLVAPGNAGHRGGRLLLADALTARGLTVLLLDYRGYGGNPGSPSEDGLARDARAGWAYLTGPGGFAPERVILFGESLGGAVVAGLAADLCGAGDPPPGGLVLRSPFRSLTAVGRVHYPLLPVGLLLRDRYEVAGRMGDVTVPTAVVYGTADSIVPPEQSRDVAEAARAVRTVAVPGADHNDPALVAGPHVVDAVTAVADLADTP